MLANKSKERFLVRSKLHHDAAHDASSASARLAMQMNSLLEGLQSAVDELAKSIKTHDDVIESTNIQIQELEKILKTNPQGQVQTGMSSVRHQLRSVAVLSRVSGQNKKLDSLKCQLDDLIVQSALSQKRTKEQISAIGVRRVAVVLEERRRDQMMIGWSRWKVEACKYFGIKRQKAMMINELHCWRSKTLATAAAQLNRSRIVKLMNLARQSPVWIQRGTFARWKLQTIILRARCRYLEAPVISASAPQANSNNAAGSGSSSPNKRSSRSTRGGEERVVFPSFDVFELREVQRLSGGQWVYPVALLTFYSQGLCKSNKALSDALVIARQRINSVAGAVEANDSKKQLQLEERVNRAEDSVFKIESLFNVKLNGLQIEITTLRNGTNQHSATVDLTLVNLLERVTKMETRKSSEFEKLDRLLVLQGDTLQRVEELESKNASTDKKINDVLYYTVSGSGKQRVETQLKLDATSQTLPGTDTGYNPGSSAEPRKPEEESLRRREQLIKEFHGKFIQLLDLAYPNGSRQEAGGGTRGTAAAGTATSSVYKLDPQEGGALRSDPTNPQRSNSPIQARPKSAAGLMGGSGKTDVSATQPQSSAAAGRHRQALKDSVAYVRRGGFRLPLSSDGEELVQSILSTHPSSSPGGTLPPHVRATTAMSNSAQLGLLDRGGEGQGNKVAQKRKEDGGNVNSNRPFTASASMYSAVVDSSPLLSSSAPSNNRNNGLSSTEGFGQLGDGYGR
eukprot:gene1322-1499_t